MREIRGTAHTVRSLFGRDTANVPRFAVSDERDPDDLAVVRACDAETAAEDYLRWCHDQADYIDRLVVYVVPVGADGEPVGDVEGFDVSAEMVTEFTAWRRP